MKDKKKKVPEVAVMFDRNSGYHIFGVYQLTGWWIFKQRQHVKYFLISEYGWEGAEQAANAYAAKLKEYYERA